MYIAMHHGHKIKFILWIQIQAYGILLKKLFCSMQPDILPITTLKFKNVW